MWCVGLFLFMVFCGFDLIIIFKRARKEGDRVGEVGIKSDLRQHVCPRLSLYLFFFPHRSYRCSKLRFVLLLFFFCDLVSHVPNVHTPRTFFLDGAEKRGMVI